MSHDLCPLCALDPCDYHDPAICHHCLSNLEELQRRRAHTSEQAALLATYAPHLPTLTVLRPPPDEA